MGWAGVQGRCGRTQTDTVWYFPSALSPTMQFSGVRTRSPSSEPCVRSTRLLVILEGVGGAKAWTLVPQLARGDWRRSRWRESFGVFR